MGKVCVGGKICGSFPLYYAADITAVTKQG